MSIKISKDGITFEVDTADELEVVLRALRHTTQAISNPITAINLTSTVGAKSLSEFYQDMEQDSRQRRVIMALRNRPEGMTDYELRSLLGLESGPALGGVLGALTKAANKAGLSSSDIIETRIGQDKSGFATYLYRLTDKMREAIENVK